LAGDPAAAAAVELAFKAALPPVGYASFVVQQLRNSSSSSRAHLEDIPAAATVTQELHDIPAAPAELLHSRQQQTLQHSSATPTAAAAPMQQLRQLSNGRLNLTLDASSGRFFAVAAADGAWSVRLRQDLLWYKSSTGEEERQASGAYIFRLAKDAPVRL
jgi:hypothetical protein